ncbi:ABC transporter permease [Paenibacillus tepidiphilus]|uniref:ABC transporter permease n=1 Tax=Paenibacillus tepidiphilus TaxID=2608683 RepID=UPI001EF11806|nr:iron chelate uptake ABC transporter family permease subunit [Paenibacillus tepidiphilus]
MILGALALGLIYGILSLGIYISFRILNIPDMTVDGSFVTGAAISAVVTTHYSLILVIPLAFLGGCLAGSITAFLHIKLKIQLLLSGILTLSALYSVNIRIMEGKPNIPVLQQTTIFELWGSAESQQSTSIAVLGVLLAVMFCLLCFFLNTKLGLSLRATGNNEQMARALGVDTNMTKWLGLAISNGFVALSGAVLVQYQSFADISMGTGVIVTGLASVIIGEVILSGSTIFRGLLAVVLGSVAYRYIIAGAIQIGMPPTDLKLMSSLIVIIALSMSLLHSGGIRGRRRRSGLGRNGTDFTPPQ